MANEDPAYTRFVRQLSCRAPVECKALRSDAHHQTGAGMGLRAHDHRTIPLCAKHHAAFHGSKHPFTRWDKAQRKAWEREQIATVQATAVIAGFEIAEGQRVYGE